MYNIQKTITTSGMHVNAHTFQTADKKAFYHMHLLTYPPCIFL